MNIVTMKVGSGIGYKDYVNFGWKHKNDEYHRSGRSSYTTHILERDKDMPNYNEIVKLESKYFSLKSQKKDYNPINGKWCLVAFLCFLIPGIIYVAIKLKQKSKINSHNKEIQKKMDEVLAEVKPLL